MELTLTFDETHFAGSSVFLFASVLERFFALSVSVNSFTQSVARVQQREGELKRWPPRSGEIALL
jgi:type VI secretion system protein ImpG